MLNKDQKRLLQDLLCICAEVLKEYADHIEAKAPQGNILHGENCEKVDHRSIEWGSNCRWAHAPEYDGPYSVGPTWLCGRCHNSLTLEQVCEMIRRQHHLDARLYGGENA